MRIKNIVSLAIICLFGFFASLALAGPMGDIGNKIDDVTISATIYAKYTNDGLLHPFKINVSTIDGVVTLTGTVDTNIEYEKAVIIARSADGVTKVNADNFKIKSSDSPVSDLFISAQIKGLLLKEKIFGDLDMGGWKVTVETKDGVVFASGEVDNLKQKDMILKIINSVDGVKSVKDDIKIKV